MMQQNEPPRRLSTELIQLDHGLKQIERSQHPGLQRAPDSLPVLEAFQSFLQTERRRARGRLLTLFIASLLMLLAISAGAIALILKVSGDLQGRVDRYALASQELATHVTEARERANDSLQGFETKLEAMQEQVTAGLTEAIRLSESNSVPLELPPFYHQAMADLHAQLAQIRSANSNLSVALEQATNQWQTLPSRPFRQVTAAVTGGSTPAPPVTDASTAGTNTSVRAVAPPETEGSMTLIIAPPGDSTPVKWRLPAIQE